jgi:hypothetical protein
VQLKELYNREKVIMTEKATLEVNGKKLEFPVIVGTENE